MPTTIQQWVRDAFATLDDFLAAFGLSLGALLPALLAVAALLMAGH